MGTGGRDCQLYDTRFSVRRKMAPSDTDAATVMRAALAGMLWSKQCYYYDVHRWLEERVPHPT